MIGKKYVETEADFKWKQMHSLDFMANLQKMPGLGHSQITKVMDYSLWLCLENIKYLTVY